MRVLGFGSVIGVWAAAEGHGILICWGLVDINDRQCFAKCRGCLIFERYGEVVG